MNKENLVVLKDALTATKGHTEFKANRFYRCLPDEQPTLQMSNGYLINGEWFDKREYASLFETVHERMIRQFTDLGLIVNGKPVSKTKFVSLADIHTYGSGRNNYKIWFFRNSREVIWGFYPMQGNKTQNANECYRYFTELVNGDMSSIDEGDVCFGNAGIPLQYGKLRVW